MLGDVPETRDATPPEAARWRFVRRHVVTGFQTHGYQEVRPAPLEPAGLAAAAGTPGALQLADGSELRADAQAALAHMFAARVAQLPTPFVRWMVTGTVFQDGPRGGERWRAWESVAGLIFGTVDPAADAETAALALNLARDLDLRAPEVLVGTLGDRADTDGYVQVIGELLPLRCATCQAQRDPLRFLTCDDEGCRALAASAPPLRSFLGVAALKHHEAVLATLEAAGFTVRDDPSLAFGAGRYQRTLVELRARSVDGHLVTVARGGRRDDLVAALGGPPTPAVGLTVGIARTAACLGDDGESYEAACEVFFASRGAGARAWALKAAAAGRALGFRTDVELRDVPWDEQVARAKRGHARVVVLAGEAERKKGEVAVRDMRSGDMRRIPEDSLSSELKRLLR